MLTAVMKSAGSMHGSLRRLVLGVLLSPRGSGAEEGRQQVWPHAAVSVQGLSPSLGRSMDKCWRHAWLIVVIGAG